MADKLDLSRVEVIGNVAPAPRSVNTPGIDAVRGEGAGARQADRLGGGGWSGGGASWMGPFGDEFAAGVGAASDYVRGQFTAAEPPSLGQLYDEHLGISRAAQTQYRDEFSLTSLAKEAAFGAAALAPRAGMAGARAVGAMLPAPSFGARAGSAAATGAAGGAAAGFGEGEGIEGRVGSAATGAAIGAGAGVALQGVSEGVRVIASGLAAVRGLKGEGAQRRAAEMLDAALKKDGVTPEMIASLSDSGKPFVLADVGPNTRALLGSAYRHAGIGREGAERFLEDRTAGQFDRMDADLARLAGARGSDFADQEAVVAARRAAAAKEGYKAAYAIPAPDLSPAAVSVLDTPAGRAAVSRARRFMENKRRPVEDGEGRFTVEMLDQIQRALRDAADSASGRRAGETARNIGAVRDDFLNSLPDELRNVMRLYASESALIDALRGGRRFLQDQPEDIAARLADMTPHEKAMFRLGVARELRGRMGAKVDGGDVSGMFQNPIMREKLAVAFDDVFQLSDFIAATKTERLMQETRNAVLKGSQTGERMVDDDQFGSSVLGDAAADVVRGGASTTSLTGAVVNAGLRAATQAKERLLQGLSEEVGDRLVTLLTQTNLDAPRRAMALVDRAPPRVPAAAEAAARRIAAPRTVAGYQAGAAATAVGPEPSAPSFRLDLSTARPIR